MEENQIESSPNNLSPLSSGQVSKNMSGRRDKKTVGLILLLIALVLIGGAVFYFLSLNKNKEDMQKEEIVRQTSAPIVVEENPVSTSTPTPEEVVDKKSISIQVLNGTGIVGEAAYLQDALGKLGYTTVKVGNAPKQDYEATQVTFSSDLSSAVVDEITGELKKIYQKVETKKTSSSNYDIEIITGLRSGQTPKASATPKSSATPKPTSATTSTPISSPTPTTSL
jgi:hypothetical protein